jgi:predicted small integral membrane protein
VIQVEDSRAAKPPVVPGNRYSQPLKCGRGYVKLFIGCTAISRLIRIHQIIVYRPRHIALMTTRLAKIILSLALAGFTFMVTFNNIIDYGSNYDFVEHVLSMDTTFPGNALMVRAITDHTTWNASYWLIIASEGATCLLLLWGAWALWRARRADGAAFNAAKSLVTIGCTFGFLLWFFGFMVIGGEWFAMWQSKIWNGQDSAFKFYMAILGVLIFVNQPDQDLITTATRS